MIVLTSLESHPNSGSPSVQTVLFLFNNAEWDDLSDLLVGIGIVEQRHDASVLGREYPGMPPNKRCKNCVELAVVDVWDVGSPNWVVAGGRNPTCLLLPIASGFFAGAINGKSQSPWRDLGVPLSPFNQYWGACLSTRMPSAISPVVSPTNLGRSAFPWGICWDSHPLYLEYIKWGICHSVMDAMA